MNAPPSSLVVCRVRETQQRVKEMKDKRASVNTTTLTKGKKGLVSHVLFDF